MIPKLNRNQPILIFGASGQIGRALRAVLQLNQIEDAIFLSSRQADFAEPNSLPKTLREWNPCIVINAAGYTKVDLAEAEESLAAKINGEAPGILAKFCAERVIPFIHYSTDYVFSDSPEQADQPWTESSPACPINAYGRSKLAGEKKIAEAGGKWIIFRTSWVYSQEGYNFLRTILQLAGHRESLKIVADQHGAPSYAGHLAQATFDFLNKLESFEKFPSGIYHLCGAGETTWFDFANAIFNSVRARNVPLKVRKVEPILAAQYQRAAICPLNSRLSMLKTREILGIDMPDWKVGLEDCLNKMSKSSLLDLVAEKENGK